MDIINAIKFADGKAFELLCQFETCHSERSKERINEEYNFILCARGCLEKEIPSKVLNTSQEYDGTYGDCPRCNRKLMDFSNFKRCPDCGQVLDWSGAL